MLCLSEGGRSLEEEEGGMEEVLSVLWKEDFEGVCGKPMRHGGNRCAGSMAYEMVEMMNSVDKVKDKMVR